MTKFLLIAFGGGLGATLRFLINDLLKTTYFFTLPSGIMLVNFIGCFCIGVAMAQISDFRSNIYFFLIVKFREEIMFLSAEGYL